MVRNAHHHDTRRELCSQRAPRVVDESHCVVVFGGGLSDDVRREIHLGQIDDHESLLDGGKIRRRRDELADRVNTFEAAAAIQHPAQRRAGEAGGLDRDRLYIGLAETLP